MHVERHEKHRQAQHALIHYHHKSKLSRPVRWSDTVRTLMALFSRSGTVAGQGTRVRAMVRVRSLTGRRGGWLDGDDFHCGDRFFTAYSS